MSGRSRPRGMYLHDDSMCSGQFGYWVLYMHMMLEAGSPFVGHKSQACNCPPWGIWFRRACNGSPRFEVERLSVSNYCGDFDGAEDGVTSVLVKISQVQVTTVKTLPWIWLQQTDLAFAVFSSLLFRFYVWWWHFDVIKTKPLCGHSEVKLSPRPSSNSETEMKYDFS